MKCSAGKWILVILSLLLISSCSYYLSPPSTNIELIYPSDHIKHEQITVYYDKIVIDERDLTKSKVNGESNSMGNLITPNSTLIYKVPDNPNSIAVGDIVYFYNIKFHDGYVVHRVIEKGSDEEGVYFITKGDNNKYKDNNDYINVKTRFEQIKYIVVGIIY